MEKGGVKKLVSRNQKNENTLVVNGMYYCQLDYIHAGWYRPFDQCPHIDELHRSITLEDLMLSLPS